MSRISCWFLVFMATYFQVHAQEDLMSMLEKESEDSTAIIITESTFSSSRIINGHSVELRSPGVLEVLISHRFGCICGGIDEFFGLDDANTRIALEFGILKNLNIGIGRSTLNKEYDGFIKYKHSQSTRRASEHTAYRGVFLQYSN